MISIKLFAYLAEIVDRSEIQIEVPMQVTTPDVIKTEIAKNYPAIADYMKTVRFAVDQVFVADDLTIDTKAKHEYALIPPVSGG